MIPLIEEIKKLSPRKTGRLRLRLGDDSTIDFHTSIIKELKNIYEEQYEIGVQYCVRFYCGSDWSEEAIESVDKEVKRKIARDLLGSLYQDLSDLRISIALDGPDRSEEMLEKIIDGLRIW